MNENQSGAVMGQEMVLQAQGTVGVRTEMTEILKSLTTKSYK